MPFIHSPESRPRFNSAEQYLNAIAQVTHTHSPRSYEPHTNTTSKTLEHTPHQYGTPPPDPLHNNRSIHPHDLTANALRHSLYSHNGANTQSYYDTGTTPGDPHGDIIDLALMTTTQHQLSTELADHGIGIPSPTLPDHTHRAHQ
eukprot:4786084-Alexandrium_andersonii.AAC.1